MKQIASPGWMHETSARVWCTGPPQRDGMGRKVGGGFRMGNTCKKINKGVLSCLLSCYRFFSPYLNASLYVSQIKYNWYSLLFGDFTVACTIYADVLKCVNNARISKIRCTCGENNPAHIHTHMSTFLHKFAQKHKFDLKKLREPLADSFNGLS